jgi:hypothetical protein
MPLRAVTQQDLSKGANLVTNPYLVGAKQGLLYLNFLLDEHGSIRTRDGTLIQTTAPIPAGEAGLRPIIKLFDFVKIDGTISRLAILLGSAGNNTLYNRATTPWTLIGTLGTKYTLPDILTFTNLALIANGYEVPWQYDGTTLSHIIAIAGQTVPPGANHHTLHQGFYWLWNTNATTTTLDGPSSLRSSDLNNPNSWPNANQIFINKDDGDSGQGMGQFTIAESGISPSTSQILFKAFSAFQMTGVFGSTNPVFSIQRIKSDMGCVAPRSIHFAPGFGLIRLTHRGFAMFDGVDDRLISEEVRPFLFGGGGFVGVDWANVQVSYGEVIPNPPLYVCACPLSGAGLSRVFVYDLVRQAWTVIQYPQALSTLQAIENAGVLPVVLMGDFNTGKVRRIFAGDADDDGAAIAWQALFRPATGSSPQQPTYYRRVIIKVAGVTAGQKILATAFFGALTSSAPRQIAKTLIAPVAVPRAPTFGFGLDPFGLGAFGAVGSGPETDLTMDLGLTGNNVRLLLTGNGQVWIRGIEFHVRQKPLSRASAFA